MHDEELEKIKEQYRRLRADLVETQKAEILWKMAATVQINSLHEALKAQKTAIDYFQKNITLLLSERKGRQDQFFDSVLRTMPPLRGNLPQ